MRMPRLKVQGRTVGYHLMSRIVGRQKLLDSQGKQKLVSLIKQQTRFSGLGLITYAIMDNHFHILVRVPTEQNPSDAELLERMEAVYGPEGRLVVLARQGLAQSGKVPGDIREKMLKRMGDISLLMKEIKQRFSRWYNRRNQREGTLWSERFTSVVVEDAPAPMLAVALYIDLNGVRAGVVQDPKEYGYCGYAAALVGDQEVRKGLRSIFRERDWAEVASAYRKNLYVEAGKAGASGKVVLDGELIKRVLEQGGRLEMGQILRLRLRHMSDGLALGSEAFVEGLFMKYRDRFGPKRKSGARRIRGVPLDHLRVLRDLRVNAVG